MKDKLRDYADRLERGEPWMHKGVKFTKWIKEVVGDMRNDADKLDAEGDGGAVPYGHEFYDASGIYHFIRGTLPGYAQTKIVPLYTYPARSGVVSAEDVNKACAGFFGSDEWYEHTDNAEMWLISMRAALEYFAKGERHER